MPSRQEIPGSVRIRTGDGNEWRFDQIERASDFFDRNRSDSVAFACEAVVELVDAAQEVLERDDLSHQQRQEIAETLSTRAVSFDVPDEPAVKVEKGN